MQMKKALLVVFVSCAFSTLSFAQVELMETDQARWQEVSLLGGIFLDGTDHFNLTGAYKIGVRKHFSIDTEASTSFLPDGTVTTFSAGINLPFRTKEGKFEAYPSGGVGVTRSGVDLGERQRALRDQGIDVDTVAWDFTLDVGLGGQIHLTEGLYWRFDYKAFMLLLNEDKVTDHYHRFAMGFAARF